MENTFLYFNMSRFAITKLSLATCTMEAEASQHAQLLLAALTNVLPAKSRSGQASCDLQSSQRFRQTHTQSTICLCASCKSFIVHVIVTHKGLETHFVIMQIKLSVLCNK